jgi:DNA modification methylase
MSLQIDYESVEALIPYAANSRTHSDAQVAQIAASIKEFGWTNPILIDGDNSIIAGHGRLMAARKLGMAEVPVICIDHLTKAQQRALVIADNQLAMNAGWDMDMLKAEIEGLKLDDFDVDLLGFDDKFLDGLLEPEPTEGLTDEDAVPEVPEHPKTVLGDVWVLGNHRLMCGDSTSIDAVEKLMDGAKADMVFTDPPYGVNYHSQQPTMYYGNGKKGKTRERILNDEDTDIYNNIFPIIKGYNNGVSYVFCGAGSEATLLNAVADNDLKIVNTLVWDKMRFGGQCLNANYKPCFEIFYYIDAIKGNRAWCGANNNETIWRLKRDAKTELHPTQKPVELAEKAIRNHSVGIVLDLFGGSGSTLIACEKANRNARLMELDPKYCDVIVKRWQDFTGKQAIHAETGEPFDASR